MQFQTIGTVSNYIKMMKLDMKYQKQKQNSWLDKDGENEDPRIRQLKEQAEQTRKSNTLQSMMGKVKAGLRLSNSEIEYLRENHPDVYRQVLEIETERAEYRREAEQCKTKEDVRKLNQRKMTQFQAEAKSISSNPNISQGQKTELLEKIQMRIANIQNEHTDFTNTPEYKALPEDNRERENEHGKVKQPDGDGVKDLLKNVELQDSPETVEGTSGYGNTEAITEATPEAESDVTATENSGGTAHEKAVSGAVQADVSRAVGKAPAFNAGRAYDASGSPARAHTGPARAVSVKV